tara:strand:+ start:1427 stop:2023 length:597 start_codon:yes stop_codon:yes gene_type:complete
MTDEKIPNIYERILAVMDDLHYVQKENKKVNNQYSFVSHDAVTAALHPLLVKHRIVMIPSIVEHTIDGNRTTATVSVAFVNPDEPDDRVVSTFVGFGIDNQDKGIGKAVSYATKYAILKTFVLETGDDPERDQIDYEPGFISDSEIESLTELIENTGTNLEKFCSHYRINNLQAMPKNRLDEAVNALSKKREKVHAVA